MKRTKVVPIVALVSSVGLFGALAGCAPAEDETPLEDAEDVDIDAEGKADSNGTPSAWSTTLNEDNINGLWTTTIGGAAQAEPTVISSWTAIGIVIQFQGRDYKVVRTTTTLSGPGVTLTLKPNKSGVSDDSIEGTIDGKAVLFVRDVSPKPPITLQLPGDRPFRSYLSEVIAPAAQRDRESYKVLNSTEMLKWLSRCELYKGGSWPRTYMKGATLSEQYDNFRKVVYSLNNTRTSPHAITHNYKFAKALQDNLKDPTKAGLAMTSFGMYFATAGGSSLRIPFTNDTTSNFITDRATRAEKIGLVVMDTPLHGPLASTFGRLLLDLGAMPSTDDSNYARTLIELLAKSDLRRAAMLSTAGRSAIMDYYAVMAIEDYRGIAFGRPTLGWGYNMTNVQFYGLVARALARPGQKDASGNPIIGQVVVGNELRPGDPSYADVLNEGNDLQEFTDMARLKLLATQYLQSTHPEMITAVQSAFSGIVPMIELDSRARSDIFHFISAQLYDARGRTANLKGMSADTAVNAVVPLIETLNKESAQFEAFILKSGLVKSNTPAPKSTGF